MLIYRLLFVAALTLFASGNTMANEMPKCVPTQADFAGSDLKQHDTSWGVDRGAGKGGQNYGLDYWVPNHEQNALVAYNATEESCISCVGGTGVADVAPRTDGLLKIPAGVHVGARIDTGSNPSGAGGSYSGRISMMYVPLAKWKAVWVDKYFSCK